MSDVKVLYGITLFFILSGLIIGAMNTFFYDSSFSNSASVLAENVKKDISDGSSSFSVSVISVGKIFLTILSMSVWTFGALPVIIDLVLFTPIRIIFWFTLIRQLFGSGR